MTDPSQSEVESRPRGVLQTLLPIVVLLAGVATLIALKVTRPEAQRRPRDDRGPLVKVVVAKSGTHELNLSANGRVHPARQVVIHPEVAGRVQRQSKELVPGGRFAEGQEMIRIDASDYQLALNQQRAQVDRAMLELEVERGRKKVAEREWQLLGEGDASRTGSSTAAPPRRGDATSPATGECRRSGAAPDNEADLGACAASPESDIGPLALRGPQLRTAKVAVAAAESGAKRAALNVSRTVIRAPFNAIVQAESSEVGQLVGPATPLATLVGTDAFYVQVSLPIRHLARIKVPGVNAVAGEGATARVVQSLDGVTVERIGHVVRLLGDLDPRGGLARLIVEVEDPLALRAGAGAGVPMLIGAFVDVEIAAGTLADVVEVPRRAVREGDLVYVANAEDQLEIREVDIVWRSPDTVLVQSGLAAGDRLITSQVSDPVAGMKVRVEELDKAATAPGEGS